MTWLGLSVLVASSFHKTQIQARIHTHTNTHAHTDRHTNTQRARTAPTHINMLKEMRAGLSLKPHKLHMAQVTCCCPLSRKGGGGRVMVVVVKRRGQKDPYRGLGTGVTQLHSGVSLNQSNDTSYQVPVGEPQQTNKQTSLNKNKATNRINSPTGEL